MLKPPLLSRLEVHPPGAQWGYQDASALALQTGKLKKRLGYNAVPNRLKVLDGIKRGKLYARVGNIPVGIRYDA